MDIEKVFEILAASEKPLKAADIVEKTGMERADIDKAIKALKKAGRIESPKVCFYTAVK